MVDLRFLFVNLFVNKYDIRYVKRPHRDILELHGNKQDEFGKQLDYEFFFFSNEFSDAQVVRYRKIGSRQVFVGLAAQKSIDFTFDEFYDKLLTTIDPGIYLNKKLADILDNLGHNKVPQGLEGKADDLLEEYVKDCLQFILSGKGRRYGKDRSFESLPDGVILGNGLTLLFDGKAYKDGYAPTADDLKRFSSYVAGFNDKYKAFVPQVYSFIVVSGHFAVGEDALSDRSDEFYELCNTKLCFVAAKTLARLVELCLENASAKEAVNWKKVFAKPLTKEKILLEQFNLIKKDRII